MSEPSANERREYPRAKVKFNVVLIGEGLRPRGCRVLDVSQGGVLLEWPDAVTGSDVSGPGLGQFFQRGDLVEVRFAVDSALGGGRQNFHLAGYVVRVVERRIAVAFRALDARLGALLDRYLQADPDSQDTGSGLEQPSGADGEMPTQGSPSAAIAGVVEATRQERVGGARNPAEQPPLTKLGPGAASMEHTPGKAEKEEMVSEPRATVDPREGRMGARRSMLVAALFLVGVVAIAALLVGSFSLQERVTALEAEMTNIVDLINDVEKDRVDATNGLREVISDVSQRVEGLGDSVVALERRLPAAPAHAQTPEPNETETPAVPSAVAKATGELPATPPGAAAPSGDPVGSGQAPMEPVAAKPAAPARDAAAEPNPHGKWMVSLIALRNKGAADRLLAKGRALDIPVEQVQVSAGGKPLWRLQISGFDSAQSAASYGEEVKAKLGLKEYWVSRR